MNMKKSELKVIIFCGRITHFQKRIGVCMYYKEHLLTMKRDDFFTLNECVVTKVMVDKTKLFFSCLYRLPNQTKEEFEEFCTDLSLLLSNVNNLNNPLSVMTGDFNAKSSNRWSLDTENAEVQEIDYLTSACDYSQIINRPTHITKELSSCIDLIVAASPHLISNTGVEFSLAEKCHHNLIYGAIDLKVPLLHLS